MRTDRLGKTSGHKCHAEGSRKEIKIQDFMYTGTANVDDEVYDYRSNNWSHRNSKKNFTEKFGSHARETFNGFTTKDSCT
jgi:hypothetical protein